jgi:hypothetical protein
MIAIGDNLEIKINPKEFQRLLGFPPDYVMQDRVYRLAQWAEAWYAKYGRPWVHVKRVKTLEVSEETLVADGLTLTSKELCERLSSTHAHEAFLVAVSAGPEAEAASQEFWKDGIPDKYFFLDRIATAAVEYLTTMVGAKLCEWADSEGMAVLPHYSPGYLGWNMDDQIRLYRHLADDKDHPLPGRLEILSSGMLNPKKSQLALFGLTRKEHFGKRLSDIVPCENCAFAGCAYRRKPYQPQPAHLEGIPTVQPLVPKEEKREVLLRDAEYDVHMRTLKKWASQRLDLQSQSDGKVNARFQMEGTTCSNMGIPLVFNYDVHLGPRDEGYKILKMTASPGADHDGYKRMCSFLNEGEAFMRRIDEEKPLLGQPLNDIFSWSQKSAPSGCLCSRASRNHKWKLVLQTLHYRLVNDEKELAGNA